MNAEGLTRADLPCVNPFCDGYGDIDISPGMTGRSRAVGACEVGPHPFPHPLSVDRRKVTALYRQAALELYAEIRNGMAWIGSGNPDFIAHNAMLAAAERWRSLLEDDPAFDESKATT